MAKTLTKIDGSVIALKKGKPKKEWLKLDDGNYKEVVDPKVEPVAEVSPVVETVVNTETVTNG